MLRAEVEVLVGSGGDENFPIFLDGDVGSRIPARRKVECLQTVPEGVVEPVDGVGLGGSGGDGRSDAHEDGQGGKSRPSRPPGAMTELAYRLARHDGSRR